jgi:hypothetical protein
MQVDIEALVEEATEVGQLRGDLRTEREKTKRLAVEVGELKNRLGLLDRLESLSTSAPKWAVRSRSKEIRQGIACMLITDTHFGEVVDPAETNHYAAYNHSIAEKRLRRAFEKFIVLARDHISGVEYDGACIPLGGDIVTGYIHDELRETNDETLAESIVHWSEQLEAGLRLVADEFGHLYVPAVPGNHDRWEKKKKSKSKARNSVTWVIYHMLVKAFADDPRVTIQPSEAADLTFTLHDHTYLLTHGDQFSGGTGISGALAPLMLGQHRKSRRNTAMGQPYDTMVMGHFHQNLTLPGLIVGNCLKGYDEFAFDHNFLPSPPSQKFWVNTPEHGPTFHGEVFVQDRKAEGW